MTLVQNLRLLLSGNKSLIILGLLFLGFSSCEMFKKAQTGDDKVDEEKTELDVVTGSGTYNPETGEYEESTSVIEDVDTVKWTIDVDADPPISSEATEEINPGSGNPFGDPVEDKPGEKLGTYNVAVMLPFFTNRYSNGNSIDPASNAALNFYGGMRIAFDELSKEGINIKATIHDTKGSESVVTDLMDSPSVTDADLIIGPFRKNNVKIAGEKAKYLQVPFVSPLSASSGVAKDNPYFIQVNPYLQTHCQAITQHARERFRTDQIVLVARNKQAEISRFRYFQDENKKIEGSDFAPRFDELIITTEGLDLEEIDVSPYIKEGDTTVFIVPSFSNKNFVYSLLLQIYNNKGENPVIVYGMPQWMEFEPPSYDYYELLNLHVSSAAFADNENEDYKDFKRKYYNKYGTIPSDRAVAGYDVMMYFGMMIDKYGTRFQEKIDTEEAEFLNSKFKFVREVPLAAALQEDFSKTNLYENKHVYILKFKDYHFQNAD